MSDRKRLAYAAIVAFACLAPLAAASQTIDGKAVKAYSGAVTSLDEQAGTIVIATDENSIGNWKVGKYTVVIRGSAREPLSPLLNSKKVKAFVSADGEVQRVVILEMGGKATAPLAMNGKQVTEYDGGVSMLNEKRARSP
jgi:hypothetical protein